MEKENVMEPVFEFVKGLYGEENVDISHSSITVYFKQIFVRSSNNRDSITIRDVYFRVSYNSRGLLTNTEMTRATRTLDEYSSGYVFSHTPGTTSFGWGRLCYGSGTSMSNLVTLLSGEFSEDNYMLLFTNLESYLSYESLDGGPYIRIGNIKSSARYNRGYIGYNDFVNAVREANSFKPIINYDRGIGMVISESDALWEEISKKFPSVCVPHNKITKREIDETPGNDEQTKREKIRKIQEINKNLVQRSLLTFKGNVIHPKVQEMELEEEINGRDNDLTIMLIRKPEFENLVSSLCRNLGDELKRLYYEELKENFLKVKNNSYYEYSRQTANKEV